MNPILYCLSNPPNVRANETIEMSLVSAVFDQPTCVVFVGDGVYQLVSDTGKGQFKDTRKMVLALPTYDVEHVYVDQNSLSERNISYSQIPDFIVPLPPEKLADLFSEYSLIVHD